MSFLFPPLKFIYSLRRDLYRNNIDVSLYLEDILNEYLNKLSNLGSYKHDKYNSYFYSRLDLKMPLIREEVETLIKIITLKEESKNYEAYKLMYSLMDKLDKHLIVISKHKNTTFYRSRAGDFRINNPKDALKMRKELFHINYQQRDMIGQFRYSVPGQICLYVCDHSALCWHEIGMPNRFSKMAIKLKDSEKLEILDFRLDYLEMCYELESMFLEYSEKNYDLIYEKTLQYLIILPLIISCNLQVKDRGKKVIPEYFIPQLLVQWMIDNIKYDGIRYSSSLHNSLVKGNGAFNYVFISREIREDGLSKNLTDKFLLSEINYVDIADTLIKYEDAYNNLLIFKEKIQQIINGNIDLDFLKKLNNEIDSVVSLYRELFNSQSNHVLINSSLNILINSIEEKLSIGNIYLKQLFSNSIYMDLSTEKDHEKNKKTLDKIYREYKELIKRCDFIHYEFEFGNNEFCGFIEM